jgi:argininosuccinate lyase
MQRAAAPHAVPDINAKSRVVVACLMPQRNTGAPGEVNHHLFASNHFLVRIAKFADHLDNIGMSSASGATFGARRKYLSMSLGFADPARSRRKSSAARKEPTFSATAAAMNWFNDTPSVAANSAAAFFTDVGSFNG